MLNDVDGRKVVVAFTDGDDTASRAAWATRSTRAREGDDDLLHRARVRVLRSAPGRVQRTRPDRGLRKLSEETGGGYFELKKTDELAPTFTRVAAGAAQPLHHRLQPDAARRQGAQARGADEAAGHDRPGAQELHRVRRASGGSDMTSRSEQEFRLRADEALEGSAARRCCRSPTKPASRSTCGTACCRSSSRSPTPAKFVVSPNAPVQQIWVSALSRSYKLTWSDDAGTFVLDGESLDAMMKRLSQQFLAQS